MHALHESDNTTRPSLVHRLVGEKHSVIREMFRYGIASVLALTADVGTLFALNRYLGVHYLVAAAAGFCVGIVVNYITSKLFVFQQSHHSRWAEWGLFFLVGITGLGLNHVIMWTSHEMLKLPVMLAKVISVGLVFFWNYLLRRYLIYPGTKD